ncbi:MAG: PQQ-dependent sugar dehydrogenase [Anaerolineae bacterium]|nr:PQQ-dependent sugar dehydrogenase [Anaerolineae bacterium]
MGRFIRMLMLLGVTALLVVGCASAPPAPTPEASLPEVARQPVSTDTPKADTPPPTLLVAPRPSNPSSSLSPSATLAPSSPTLQPGTPTPTEPPTPTAAPFAPRVEVVARNLQVPWALAFAEDGRLFFTERPGSLRVIVDGTLEPEPVAELAVASSGEGGLLGLTLDPAFVENGHLYAMYTYSDGGRSLNRISRLTLRDGRAGDEQTLLDQIPGARFHDGGRLAFGPDGTLYATTGDAGNPDLAQNLDSLAGKILRLNPDGSVPDDNPFPGSLVYSYGHRNPQGLAWQPGTGILWSTEHGPSGEFGLCCRDELNRIQPGANYGWPAVTADGGDPRFIDPVLHSGNDTWAPAAVAFSTGEALAPWQGALFFGALRGAHLQRVTLGGPQGDQVVAVERLYVGDYGRIREVAVGPDGYLYFTTSNRDGRGRPASDDDRILRIVP